MILGWGKKVVNNDLQGVRERVGSSIQQKLALPVLSKSECGRRFREPRPDQICAGGEEGKGFCAVSTPIVKLVNCENLCFRGIPVAHFT